MTDISDDELVGLSEFALLPENAEQAGVEGPVPQVQRIDAGSVSALQWGDSSPRVVFLHGGGQNAHTWDTVIVGLGQPALAVDLPGHGHSAWREDGNYSPQNNAATVAPVLNELAPHADLVVGMSLGGLTAIGLGAIAPHLVRELVLVDTRWRWKPGRKSAPRCFRLVPRTIHRRYAAARRSPRWCRALP